MATRRHKPQGEPQDVLGIDVQMAPHVQFAVDMLNTMRDQRRSTGPAAPPDFTDEIIRAVMRSESMRMQTGRTRQAAFGQSYIYGGLFPTRTS